MAKEKRFVDLDVLTQSIEDEHSWLDTLDDFRELVRMQPTVDATEVVRCKDCTEWGGVPFGNVCRRWSAPLVGMKNCTGPDDFCSYGERRDKDAVD